MYLLSLKIIFVVLLHFSNQSSIHGSSFAKQKYLFLKNIWFTRCYKNIYLKYNLHANYTWVSNTVPSTTPSWPVIFWITCISLQNCVFKQVVWSAWFLTSTVRTFWTMAAALIKYKTLTQFKQDIMCTLPMELKKVPTCFLALVSYIKFLLDLRRTKNTNDLLL